MDSFVKYIKFYSLSFLLTFTFIIDLLYLNCLDIVWNVNIENGILLVLFIAATFSWLKATIKYSYNLFTVTLNFISLLFLSLLYSGIFVIFETSIFTTFLSTYIQITLAGLCALQVVKFLVIYFTPKPKVIIAPTMKF